MSPSTEISTALVILCWFQFTAGSYQASITIVNNCKNPIVTSISSDPEAMPLPTTGITLPPVETTKVDLPPNWSGRITGQSTEQQLPQGSEAQQPVTAAVFKMNSAAGGLDIFDVSVVDGYNMAMIVEPHGGNNESNGNCMATGCVGDLNMLCPFDELKVMSEDGKVVGCKSACQAFGEPQFCCTGDYETPNKCKPSTYSLFFKNVCPRVRSYVYDQTSTWTSACLSSNYVITFCPSSSPGWISPRNEKQPAKKTNTGDFEEILNNILKFMGIILATITVVYSIYSGPKYMRRRRPTGGSQTGSKTAPTDPKTAPTDPKTAPTGSISVPTGSITAPTGSITVPTGSIYVPTGLITAPTGSIYVPTGSIFAPTGSIFAPTSSVLFSV